MVNFIVKAVSFLLLYPCIAWCQKDISVDNDISGFSDISELSDISESSEDLVFPSLKKNQSMAFYGDYAVFVTPVGRTLTCNLSSIESGKQLASTTLPYDGYRIPHANAACFGSCFFSNTSVLPVLYVSSWNNGRQVFVYDISKVEEEYSASLIQVIDPQKLNEDIVGMGYMDWVVDSEGGYLFSIAYHLKGTSQQAEGNYTHITKYRLPSITDRVVFLEDTEIIDSFQVPVMTVFQDKAYYKNHIYVVAGMPSKNDLYPPRFFDIDLDSKKMIEYLIPLTGEPEGFCVYDGIKWLNMYGSTTVYNLDKML